MLRLVLLAFVGLVPVSDLLAESGGQTKESPSGWTVDTVKTYLESKIDDADKRYEQRFRDQTQALTKQDAATEKRFEGVNEFRNQLRDQNVTFMARTEALSRIDANAAKIDQLSKQISDREATSAGSTQTWGLLAAGLLLFCTVIGMIVGVIGFIFVVASRKKPQVP